MHCFCIRLCYPQERRHITPNFLKKQEELDHWKMYATPEDIDYMECQREMEQDLIEQANNGDPEGVRKLLVSRPPARHSHRSKTNRYKRPRTSPR